MNGKHTCLFCNHFSQKQLFALKCSAKTDILQVQCKLDLIFKPNALCNNIRHSALFHAAIITLAAGMNNNKKKIAHNKTQHAGTSQMSMFLSSLTWHVLRRIILTSLAGWDQRPALRLNKVPITCPSLGLLEYECSLSQGSGSYQVNILNIEILNLILNAV